MAKEYDLIVIGTGSAGYAPAFECRSAGWKVAVIDSRPYGGTCALRGCDPKKVLVGAAETVERGLLMKGKGISGNSEITWPELIRYKRMFTADVPEWREKGFSKVGIDMYHGMARFTGKDTIAVGDNILEAKYITIATGARPKELDLSGEQYITTSDQFLETDELPETITFIGGGYISFEFAHIAAHAGAEVRILHRSARPLKRFDPDLVKMLVEASENAGIEVRLDMPVKSIEDRSGELVVRAGENGEYGFESGMVVHGGGRVPDVDGLDLEKGAISYDSRGIVVNEFMQSVSNPSVYAAGDVAASGLPLTPVASKEGSIVAHNLLRGNTAKADYTAIPSVVFTTPPLASVGIQEQEAEKAGLNYTVDFQDTSSWYSSRRIGLNHSGFKVLIEKDANRILGAHLLGYNAEEVINIFAMAMRVNLTANDLKKMIWAYPTNSSDISYML